VLYHSSLPFPASDQLTVYPPPPPSSPQALEALRILANLLVLQEAGRKRFANAGGALAIARALARKAANEDICEHAEDVDRVFLLGRIGFLVTVDRAQAVEDMVDKDDLVNSLIYVG
jgi:hypothetical protein